jgi:imidazolonepropionase-like amidohydrolase
MKRKGRPSGILWGLLLIATAASSGEVILIQNGTIVPVVGTAIPGGSLLIEDGKIAKIGPNIAAPEGAVVIDARGMFVYPGLVAVMTAVGVTGYPGAGNDTDEVGVSTPHMDPYDALNPEDDSIEVTRVGGVTTVQTLSGTRSVINGKSIALNLTGDLAEDMVIHRYIAQIINLTAREENKYPSTIPGIVAFLRDKFDQAKQAAEKPAKAGIKAAGDGQEGREGREESSGISRRMEMEALIPVVTGKVPVIFITSDEVSVRKAIELIQEYRLKGIIQGGDGILKYADRLAQSRIPVLWGGTRALPERWEPYDKNYHTAAVLAEKDVLFAFDPGGRRPESRNTRNLPVPAAISVAHGLSEDDALRAMTINPARILRIDDQVGSLEVGKTANVVIWTESPIQLRARVETVIIAGRVIPLTSLQTRLYERYAKIVKERMTKK